jgi:hypothetical protein
VLPRPARFPAYWRWSAFHGRFREKRAAGRGCSWRTDRWDPEAAVEDLFEGIGGMFDGRLLLGVLADGRWRWDGCGVSEMAGTW